MRIGIPLPSRALARLRLAAGRFCADCRGVAAIEFGLVALPFFAMMIGIMAIGLQYFTEHALDSAVMDAARKLRTGEAQKAGLTIGDFRTLVCDAAAPYIACDNHLIVHVNSGATFADLNPPTTCVTSGALTPAQGQATDLITTRSGTANAAVLVVACYEWDMGSMVWQPLWRLLSPSPQVDGKTVLSSSTAFRSEPYQ